jgi:hypothetical protein
VRAWLRGLLCRLGRHDDKHWYAGWAAPDGAVYDLDRCGRPGCYAIHSTSVRGVPQADRPNPERHYATFDGDMCVTCSKPWPCPAGERALRQRFSHV